VPYLSISYTNFRNIHDGTIDLLGKEVYFVGDNGQGKSNILESLYLSAYGNSFRTRNDAEIIRNGENSCSVRAIFRDQRDHTNSINTFLQDGKKRIEKNAKNILDRKELVDTIPCVLFSHEDLDFSVGSPDRKRFFIDQSLSMYDSSYIDVLRQYKKILKTRNNILKEKNTGLLDIVDFQLVEKGLEVIKRRTRTITDFNRIFARLYEEVSGISNVTIDYTPSWKTPNSNEVLAQLAEKRNMDLLYGTSMSGPHRDHIRFFRDKKTFVPTASTGQRRLLSLLLRTAQAQFYTEVSGKKPVLLMDDVMLELDPDKRQRFTALLPDYDQLFCTFLPGEPYERYKKTTTRIYNIDGGQWNE
jgi:recF protein